jgi:hypothetical protein
MTTLRDLLSDFANRLQEVIEAQAVEDARATVLGALGLPPRRGLGRPPKASAAIHKPPLAPKARKKAPLQLCPVPYCRNAAAPVFGMVCAKHKDVPKAQIKKYREARRAKKLGVKPAKRGRRAPRAAWKEQGGSRPAE